MTAVDTPRHVIPLPEITEQLAGLPGVDFCEAKAVHPDERTEGEGLGVIYRVRLTYGDDADSETLWDAVQDAVWRLEEAGLVDGFGVDDPEQVALYRGAVGWRVYASLNIHGEHPPAVSITCARRRDL